MSSSLCACGRIKARRSDIERVVLSALARPLRWDAPDNERSAAAYQRLGGLEWSADYTLAALAGRCTWCIEAFPVQLAAIALVAAGGAL